MITSHGQRPSTEASSATPSHHGARVLRRDKIARQIKLATCSGCIAGTLRYFSVGSIIRVLTSGRYSEVVATPREHNSGLAHRNHWSNAHFDAWYAAHNGGDESRTFTADTLMMCPPRSTNEGIKPNAK